MSIDVTCSNGHKLRVKEKYAGKQGLCPHCKAAVFVPIPVAAARMSDSAILSVVGRPTREEPDTSHEDALHHEPSGGSSMSLASASFVRKHTKVCQKCKSNVLATYDLCPHCHTYFTDWAEIARRMASRCVHCGAENPPNVIQCDLCGHDLRRP